MASLALEPRDWTALLRDPALVVITGLDGTLLPFAASADTATFDEEASRLLRALAASGVRVAVVSGRPASSIDRLRRGVPGVWWFAEHGAWRCDDAGWTGRSTADAAIDALVRDLRGVAARFTGASIERKSGSISVHWRPVPPEARPRLFAAIDPVVDEWLESHPEHERSPGADAVEIRPRAAYEAAAVAWLRERAPGARIVALGDGATSVDLFLALGERDLAISVGRPIDRRCHVAGVVDDVVGARRFLGWLLEARAAPGAAPPAPISAPPPRATLRARAPLLVVSNRIPAPATGDRQREVGGLVAALQPALRAHDGVWLGWSGHERDADVTLEVDPDATPVRASFDFPPRWRRLFYGGFCNRSLWPLLHGFPSKVRYEDDEWTAYVEANDAFARLATDLVDRDGVVWIHDYHLLLAAAGLRHRGHRGPIGLFLHVPFPSRDAIDTLPYAHELLDAMLSFDLIGLHTPRWADSFSAAVRDVLQLPTEDGLIVHGRGSTAVDVFPIPIDAAPFRPDPSAPLEPDAEGLITMLGDRRLLLGVDRLDYSKGVPERLEAFERLLERHAEWRGRACFVQISVPSRADVPEYADLRDRVEHLVGRINGRFGEANWVPVRYLYRSYDQRILAQMYRIADVGVVTPLRDGMNLVAKEFVAAQDPARPGVLVLSRMAGAAYQLDAAVLANPYHRDGLADELHRALSMPADERRQRHASLLATVLATTPDSWAAGFLDALAAIHRHSSRRDRRAG
jgi:alpha,alpha-trehalose-phosphate synthase [UDP-forming]/trehalose-phosphatase